MEVNLKYVWGCFWGSTRNASEFRASLLNRQTVYPYDTVKY